MIRHLLRYMLDASGKGLHIQSSFLLLIASSVASKRQALITTGRGVPSPGRNIHHTSRPSTYNIMHNLPLMLQGMYHSRGPEAAQAEAVFAFVQITSIVGRMCRFLEDCSQSHSESFLAQNPSHGGCQCYALPFLLTVISVQRQCDNNKQHMLLNDVYIT